MPRALAGCGFMVNRPNGILVGLVAAGVALGGAACKSGNPAAATGTTVSAPVAAQPMPPIPDLSRVRTFTRPITGVLTSGVGVQPATLVHLGDLR